MLLASIPRDAGPADDGDVLGDTPRSTARASLSPRPPADGSSHGRCCVYTAIFRHVTGDDQTIYVVVWP